jgi:preprotein translocase subunit SecB
MSSATDSQAQPNFTVKGQYIKDLSFENPNAPQSLMASASAPNIDVSVDLKATRLQEHIYETTLHLSARASAEGSALFLVDLVYAGIFELKNIPAERVEGLLMVECPFVLFPFARRVIADVSRDGGFPPLMLDPIDFHALYLHNAARKSAPAA